MNRPSTNQEAAQTRPKAAGTRSLAVALLVAGMLAGEALVPQAAEAQSPAPVAQGTRSLSFGIDGDGSPQAGIWYFISDRTNLGLLGTLDWVSEDREGPPPDRSTVRLGVGPALKWYMTGAPRVNPFWLGGLHFVHQRRSEDGEPDRTSRSLALDGGFGVDWFPVDQMSVGGWTGLRFSSTREENDNTTTRLHTLTTGLTVHIYF